VSDVEFTPPELRSDASAWEFDLAIQQTGRVQHFFMGRRLPEAVKTYAMLSKHLATPARRLERLAKAEAEAGHDITAMSLYFDAAGGYAQAQHTLFGNSAEKRMLHAASLRCYQEVRRLSPTTIEHVDIEWDGKVVSGYLHLAPVEGPAPLVFFIPGIDMTKEMTPEPFNNWALQRGMHLFVFDGPGQGESNLRDVALTNDNYEDAVSTALTALAERPEVDADNLLLYSMSFGSYWGARVAATEPRFKAAVLQWASVTDPEKLFGGVASPRYKHVLAYVTRSQTEDEVDAFIAGMPLGDLPSKISMPTLTTVGEFDQRSPLPAVYGFFDQISAPAELWVFADQHHQVSLRGKAPTASSSAGDCHALGMDWLKDRVLGKELRAPGEVTYVDGSVSPNDPAVKRKRFWYED
jgi:pimeloyl-ACP methyl ester carboxylesterase